MHLLLDQKTRASITTYLCILVSIIFAIPVSSEVMDYIFRIMTVIVLIFIYIFFIMNEKPEKRILISASIPSFGWTIIEFLWHVWMIKSGKEAWKGGFLITIGGPIEVPIETFILLSLIIIQSYVVTSGRKYLKVISYVALTGFIFGIASYLLELFGIMEGFFILRGTTVPKFSTPLKFLNFIFGSTIICVILYCTFYGLLIFMNRIIPPKSKNCDS